MGALVICVTRGMEGKLVFVELFPGAAFYGSQVLLADSDPGLILSTIGRLLGSPHVRLYTHVSLHATLWPVQVTTENQTCKSHASCWMSDCPKHENLIYNAESMFVCLFVPYTNSHFQTNLNQTLHTTPPWSGRDRRVCMVRKCLTFSTFLTFSVGSGCRILGTKWLPARVIRDSVISVILAGVCVTSRKWRCSRRQFRVLTGSVVHYG
jgi:hypothetical protein